MLSICSERLTSAGFHLAADLESWQLLCVRSLFKFDLEISPNLTLSQLLLFCFIYFFKNLSAREYHAA